MSVPETGTDYATSVYKYFHPDGSAVVVRSKEWVCGCLRAGIAGSNTEEFVDICLLWELCVVA